MKQLDLSLDGVTNRDLKIAREVHDFYPPYFLVINSDTSDLYTRIPYDENPVDFIINHLRNYVSANVSSIRVYYYDVNRLCR